MTRPADRPYMTLLLLSSRWGWTCTRTPSPCAYFDRVRSWVGTCVIPRTAEAVRRLVASWAQPELVRACYEAGPTGCELHRLLVSLGISCQVIAPALVPGVRVKTDRRDAESLARFLREGERTPIRIPSVEEEAVRDLRALAGGSQSHVLRAKHRLSKFLLRQGRTWPGKNWTQGHFVWLRKQRFAHEALAARDLLPLSHHPGPSSGPAGWSGPGARSLGEAAALCRQRSPALLFVWHRQSLRPHHCRRGGGLCPPQLG